MLYNKEVGEREEKKNIKMLNGYFNKAMSIVKKIIGKEEVEYLMEDKGVYLDISYETEDWAGLCTNREYYYEIKVRYDVLYHCEPKKIIEILIHEILHTFCNTRGHDAMWCYYADLITDSTPYSIPIGDWFDEK